jgi:hypothetical protein
MDDPPLPKDELILLAEALSLDGQRGWLTPEGAFFEADETPPLRICGLELGGHEKAALEWLEQRRPKLHEKLEEERIVQGFLCWEETDGHDVIKKFMFANGFLRVADDLCFGN